MSIAASMAAALVGTAAADEAPAKLIAEGHFKRARSIVEARLATRPDDAEAVYLLSRIQIDMGERDGALATAEKAVAAQPNNSSYHVQLAEVVGVLADHAAVLAQIGLSRRFKKELDVALTLDPKNTEALFDSMRYYVRAPALFGGDKDKAHALAAEIAAIDPVEGAFAFVHLAKAEGEPEKIEGLLRGAVEVRPESYAARAALAEWHFRHGQLDLAEKQAVAAELLDAGRTRACLVRASIVLRRAQWDELEATLADCEKRVPDDLSPYYRIATMLNARATELARAERYLRKYLTQEPEGRRPSHAHAWWRLGQNLAKQGRKPEAIAAFEQSVALDADSPAAESLKRLS
jgi:tetratricopeptide (TPR) repeat protein